MYMSGSENHGLPKSLGTSFPNEDDIPRLDHGNHVGYSV